MTRHGCRLIHKATSSMPPFKSHIFICCNTREPGHPRGCCNPDASDELRNRFKVEVQKHRLSTTVRANKSGCLDQCELGPTVVIYPAGVWYGGVTVDDVSRIVSETVIGGRVIDELLIPDALLNTKGRGLDSQVPPAIGSSDKPS